MIDYNLNWAFQILKSGDMLFFSMNSIDLGFKILKPCGLADITASTASDVLPHRYL